MANGEKARYDKAKNGWNRDWETDNIPDDTTSDGCDCQPIEFEEGTRHHVDCALRREQSQASRPQESSFINWADEASEGGEKPSQAAASTRSGIGAREFAQQMFDCLTNLPRVLTDEQTVDFYEERLQAYAAEQVRQATKMLADWMSHHSFATGHGDSIKDLLGELSWQVRELRQERDALQRECFALVVLFKAKCTDEEWKNAERTFQEAKKPANESSR